MSEDVTPFKPFSTMIKIISIIYLALISTDNSTKDQRLHYQCAVVVTIAQDLTMDHCSVTEIEAARKECINAYAGGQQDNLHEICSNVECYLQCMEDAVGDCSNRDMFFWFDMKVFKTLYRAQCDNYTLSQIADVVCQVETPCVDDRFHKEQVDLMNKLANATNSFETKQLECSLSAKSKTCLEVKPSNSCSPELAKLRENLEIVKLSLSQCQITQDNLLFKKYSGDIKCTNPKIESKCFTASVMSRLSKCTPVTLTTFMSRDRIKIDGICKNVDCTSQCYFDAMEKCYNKDQHVMLDPEMIKVSTRASCDNVDGLSSTIQRCRMTDTSCLHALGKSLATAQMYIRDQRYKEYKDLVCSATSKFRSCIVFDKSDNCTKSMATLAKNLYEVWHTYSACGKPSNPMFRTYSEQLKCDSSGSHMMSSFSIIIVLNFVRLFTFV